MVPRVLSQEKERLYLIVTCVRNIKGKTLAVGERFVGSPTHTDEFLADSLVNFVKADL
jgi:hypothetical protein